MSLRELAEVDMGNIMSDTTTGFAWPITVVDPAGTSADMTGLTSDISQIIDPDTGQMVSGRLATVSIRYADLAAAGLGYPEGIADGSAKPWRVSFDDINGQSYDFKVRQSSPDRAIGAVVCILEGYSA